MMRSDRPSDPGDGWAFLEEPDRAAAASPEPLARLFARVFAGTDGAVALAHLRAVTVDRRLPPACPEAALRHLEGMRALSAYVAGLVARGRALD